MCLSHLCVIFRRPQCACAFHAPWLVLEASACAVRGLLAFGDTCCAFFGSSVLVWLSTLSHLVLVRLLRLVAPSGPCLLI